MSTGAKGMLVTVGGLIAIIVLDAVLVISGWVSDTQPQREVLVLFLPWFWMVGIALYCVLFDPMKHFSGKSFVDRVFNLFVGPFKGGYEK